MAISNLTQGLRPGVCTSTTRPTAPYEGQMIYETDTNRVLVWDNAAWVMIADTDTPPGLQLIKTETFTSDNSIDIDSCFNADFANYRVECQWLHNTTAGVVNLKLKDTGGTISTNYGSRASGSFRTGATNFFTAYSNLNDLTGTAGVFIGSTNTGTRGYAAFDIFSPYLAQQTNVMGQFMGESDGTNTLLNLAIGGWQNSSTVMVGMNIAPSAGTMTGVARVYGYRN